MRRLLSGWTVIRAVTLLAYLFLFGPIVVEEDSPPAVDLETIVILSDWRLDPSGQLADLGQTDLGRGAGRIGAVLTANSTPAPLQAPAAPGARVRLRLANAATARVMGIFPSMTFEMT